MTYPETSEMTEPVLQLYTFQLCPFAHRVRLALEEDHIGVWPDREGPGRDGPVGGGEVPS